MAKTSHLTCSVGYLTLCFIMIDSVKQGTNARKVISEVYAFFVLQCSVFGRKSKHKTDVTPWHGIHFHENNLWSILVIGNYYVNYQNIQTCFYAPQILNEHWCIYSYLQIPPRENWFQYVRRVYTTAIYFPWISSLEWRRKYRKLN